MNFSTNPLTVMGKHGRGRVTLPLAHLLICPLKVQFIAAYPRSGSTWLRTMLVNLLYRNSNSDPEVFNKIIPGTSIGRVGRVYAAPSPRIISTHSNYRCTINRAVYLIRDGRDSVVSLFHYTTSRGGINMDFKMWFAQYMSGFFGLRWDQNAVSWLSRGRKVLGERMLFVRYEDFLANTLGELAKVCNFLGINAAQEELTCAIEASTIEKGREWEKRYQGEIKDPNASFYRGGKCGEWRNLFSENQKKAFLRVSEKALRLGGYI
jgi:hypothetical protein